MKPVDILVLLLVAGALALAFHFARSRKSKSACCGCPGKVERAPVADRTRSHYPYELSAEITGLTCENCAREVENALNTLPGVWASVKTSGRARILCKTEPSKEEIKSRVLRAGFGVKRCAAVRRRGDARNE